ncbi:MAG: AraC family transcriptional regulator ligand-binding domain-containing protein [Rhodobacteraceae bacterium]|nr:AraC family transcriptional regulator ligand-binding domain-containing protein [Paracoccaceae bacterium]
MFSSWISEDAFCELAGRPGSGAAAAPDAAETGLRPLADFVRHFEEDRSTSEDGARSWVRGEGCDLAQLGPLGQAVLASRTLGEALRTFQRGFPVLQSATEMTFTQRGDEVRLGYRVLDPRIWPRRADAELSLGVVRTIAARYGVPKDAIVSVSFEHAPDRDPRGLARHIGRLPHFGEPENAVTFAARALSARPVAPPAPNRPFEELWAAIEHALKARRAGDPAALRVRQALLGRIGRGDVSQQSIAAALGLSERSLRRALADEGVTFKEVLAECRKLQSVALLRYSSKALSEVALLLGYSDQTAFSRAFARWYGMSPSEFRRSGAASDSTIV